MNSDGTDDRAGRICPLHCRYRAATHATTYGTRIEAARIDVHIDALPVALPVAYDDAHWQADFLGNWPPDSPAHESYWSRIVDGPKHLPRDADRLR